MCVNILTNALPYDSCLVASQKVCEHIRGEPRTDQRTEACINKDMITLHAHTFIVMLYANMAYNQLWNGVE